MERIQLIQTIGIFLATIGIAILLFSGPISSSENIVGEARMVGESKSVLTSVQTSYLSNEELLFIQLVENDKRTARMSASEKRELLEIQRELVRAVKYCPELQAVAKESKELGVRAGAELESRAQQAIANCEVLRPDIRDLAINGDYQIQKGFWDWIGAIISALGCSQGNIGECLNLALMIYDFLQK